MKMTATPVIPIDEFKEWWGDNHPILLDVSKELPYYYEVFLRFYDILHNGGMQIDEDITSEKASLMSITAAVKFAELVEDLAGPNTLQILSKYIPSTDDFITWIIGMIRPVTFVSDECRKKLQAEITGSVANVTSHLLLDWMKKCLKSKDFLKYKEVALWFVNDHYVLSSYTEEPRYMMLDIFSPMFKNVSYESQQVAQSYIGFNWTFHISENSFTIPQLVKEWATANMPAGRLPLQKMVVLMPTLYKVEKTYEDGVDLVNQQGKQYHAVYDLCSRMSIRETIYQSLLVVYAGNAHFNGPSVLQELRRFGTWRDEQMNAIFRKPETYKDIYPRLAIKKALQDVDYDFVPEDPAEEYEKKFMDTFDYYSDNTPHSLDGCLTVMEGWATKAEQLLPSIEDHFRVFCIAFGIFRLFPVYYVNYEMADYTRYNGRIRNLFTRLENALVAGYLTGEGHNERGTAPQGFIKLFIELNKHPFYKDLKRYNLNHLIKTLKKMK